MKKLMAFAVMGMIVSAPSFAAEQGTTGTTAAAGDAAATNVPLTVGIAVATAAGIGAAVNAAAGDDSSSTTTTTTPTTTQ